MKARKLRALFHEFLEPTPSAVAKLLAAWEGLSVENQILILAELSRDIRLPRYLADKVAVKALDSRNSYIRYLGAKALSSYVAHNSNETALLQRIEKDPDPLVRYSRHESAFLPASLTENPARFFSLPQEERLAIVRGLRRCGEGVAALLCYGAEHELREGRISEMDLFEIVSDYVKKPGFRKDNDLFGAFSDYYREAENIRNLEALWRTVPKLPEDVSLLFIENLPVDIAMGFYVPQDVLDALTKTQLSTLFYRKDARLRGQRERLFRETLENPEVDVDNADLSRYLHALVAYNFDPDFSVFSEILRKPEKIQLWILTALAKAEEMRLCMYDVVYDILSAANLSDAATYARDVQKRQLRSPRIRKEYCRDLYLYRLASKYVASNKEKIEPPSGELAFLADHVIPGDTWGTFLAFREAWFAQGHRLSETGIARLASSVPSMQELDDSDSYLRHRKHAEREKPRNKKLDKPLTRADFIYYKLSWWNEVWLLVLTVSACATPVLLVGSVIQLVLWVFANGQPPFIWLIGACGAGGLCWIACRQKAEVATGLKEMEKRHNFSWTSEW